jgi:hypothetical protein
MITILLPFIMQGFEKDLFSWDLHQRQANTDLEIGLGS